MATWDDLDRAGIDPATTPGTVVAIPAPTVDERLDAIEAQIGAGR